MPALLQYICPAYFHKNFDLVAFSFKDYLEKGYSLYICSDSMKQTDRIKAILKIEVIRLILLP